MNSFRTRWLAVFAGTTLIALSVSAALGADPKTETNKGLQGSTFGQGFVTPDDTTPQADEAQPSNHGACVSEVAQSDEVGGKNENHGGAVSEAARVTCSDDTVDTEEPADEQDQTEVEADDSAETEADAEDANESDTGHGQSEGHGGGHDDKGGSSDS